MAYYMASRFSRTVENEKKMGAYYTDTAHCRDIRKMFVFPKNEEVSVLEPSIGDGSAVIAVTGADTNPNIKIFGVELNDETARATKQNPYITECLKADFTNGVTIRNNCFSFCFGNPPYMSERTDSGEGKERMERTFLDKVIHYLKYGGVLVWVIPYSVFSEVPYMSAWMRELDTLAIYKFRKEEYEKWHQVVVVGRKRHKRTVSLAMTNDYINQWNLSNLPELPSDLPATIEVYPSAEKDVDIFSAREFDEKMALTFLGQGLDAEIKSVFNRLASQIKYDGGTLSRPPIPLKKDSKYLLVTSGFTDGEVGSEETGDLHMMRGVASVVEHLRYANEGDEDEDTEKQGVIIATTSTEVQLRVLECDGTLTLL